MIRLSQRDPLWASKKMGESELTLGRWGCTTTCISMLSDYFKCYRSPLELASNVHHYTRKDYPGGAGLVLWPNMKFDGMRWVKRLRGRNDAMIDEALRNPNTAVILQVNNGAHWVVAYSRVWGASKDWWCIDPWDGKKKLVLKSFGNITGMSFYEGKDFGAPSDPTDVEFAKELGARDYPFFLAQEQRGEIWFVHPDGRGEYIGPDKFQEFMEKYATGISNADLAKIPKS